MSESQTREYRTMRRNLNYVNASGQYAPAMLTAADGRLVINPTAAQYRAAGYSPKARSNAPTAQSREERVESREAELRQLLMDTDYQVIKNAEATAAGLQPPYDPATLHATRQAWRDEINGGVAAVQNGEGLKVSEADAAGEADASEGKEGEP